MKVLSLITAAAFSLSISALAKTNEIAVDDSNSVVITEVAVPQEAREYFENLKNLRSIPQWHDHSQQPNLHAFDFSVISGFAGKAWSLVSGLTSGWSGKLTVTPMQGVDIIPANINLIDMENWKDAPLRAYRLTVKGVTKLMTAFSYTYTVGYQYGGQVEGKGAFIGNLSIFPSDAKCGMTWACGVDVVVGKPLNYGTKDSPIVGVDMSLNYNLVGKFIAKAGGDQFSVRGDGTLARKGSPASEEVSQSEFNR